MIYGNVKACIPLCRQKLRAEFSKKAGAPRYRKDALIPIDEEMAFGIVTKSQVGYIPSIDICFTDDEKNFFKDSYIFRSLKSQ